MDIDATTLADLEIFPSPDGSDGVFHLIDRTSIGPGRTALRRRVAHPLSDLGKLRRTQEAVRVFIRHPQLVRFDQRSLEAVDRYFRSTIEVHPAFRWGERIEYPWVAVRHRDALREIRDGVRATVGLFTQLAGLGRSIAAAAPPRLIAELRADPQSEVLEEALRRILGPGTDEATIRRLAGPPGR